MTKKRLKGTIVSDKQEKTVIVEVERIKRHPKYIKRYATHKRYKAHDSENKHKAGEEVIPGDDRSAR